MPTTTSPTQQPENQMPQGIHNEAHFDGEQFIQDVTEYLDQAEAHLANPATSPPPDHSLTRRQLPPDGAIVEATPASDEYGPRMDVVVRDKEEDRTPRYFDPWFFLTILLLALAGVPLVWHKKRQKGKWYFRLMLRTSCAAKDGPRDGVPVTRWIAGTDPGFETPSKRGHYEYRRDALQEKPASGRPYPPRFGREDIMRLAPGLHDQAEPLRGLSGVTLRSFLERALSVADRLHEFMRPNIEAE